MQKTDIEWTDLSANPLKYRRADGSTAWACIKVSPGCAHCYSEAIGQRWNRGSSFTTGNMAGLTPFMDPKELKEMITRKTCQGLPVDGSRCFVGDMTDLFGEWVPFELLDQLFAAMALRPQVTFQLLTKRPERMAEYLCDSRLATTECLVRQAIQDMAAVPAANRPHWMTTAMQRRMRDWEFGFDARWPLPNVWLGTSVENQQAAEERIPHLRRCPASVRFLSVEPLLERVDLHLDAGHESGGPQGWIPAPPIDQVIVGCESGPKRREMRLDWVEDLVAQCRMTGTAAFVKQLDIGGKVESDMERFPLRLRLRQFPEVRA